MMRKANYLKTLLFAIFLTTLIVGSVGLASAATHYVNPGELIQTAVTAANPGDTIIVRDGTYSENIDINKRLTIQSENGSKNCTVQATNSADHVFSITADYVNISGFNITGATGFLISGIHVSADYCNISNNYISNYGHLECVGITLYQSANNTIINNSIVLGNSRIGCGIYVNMYCSNNEITLNNFTNLAYGVGHHGFNSNNNVNYNIFYNNTRAVTINYDSTANIITRNSMISNNYGISFDDGGNSNIIYLNNFINNINNMFLLATVH